jgi:hypothetical protein
MVELVSSFPRFCVKRALDLRDSLKMSDGLGISDAQIKPKLLEICPICATSRALNRIPREPARRHYENIGDLLIIDL